MIPIMFLWALLILMPGSAPAETFFEREAQEQRLSWRLFPPEELIEAVFPNGDEESLEFRLEANIPARRLFFYRGDQLVESYPIAVGSLEFMTPPRKGAIREIHWNPWWYPPEEEWAKDVEDMPPGPDNPLGKVKMPVSGDIILHGTNAEATVGQPVSHGCMRMRNREIEELAWFFQSRFSKSREERLLQKYHRLATQTFTVRLDRAIPVAIIYDRVAIREKEVVIYPDIYRQSRDLNRLILEELSAIGIPPSEVDPFKLDEINRTGGRRSVPITDLLFATGDANPGPSGSPQGS